MPLPRAAGQSRCWQSADKACNLFAGHVADAAIVHPYPVAGAAENFCDLGGAEKHLTGVKLGSAGTDGDKGVTVEGLFTGHGGYSFLKSSSTVQP
uniref:Uncharacterized protein n=1 Tax=Ackermannviridae sp. TaxID=2831612 RepID=A0A8S5VPL3_9CAUD|nr:MAG TPA: hypothetical protein [Ackermannviridae sp.]